MIFVYGGSTTYDWTVTQGETWTERLQSELNGEFIILNLGAVGHSTTQHVINTAFYQGIVNKPPNCAIYYVGWNDIYNAHVEDLDPAYANYHTLHLVVRKPEIFAARYSPLLRLAYIAAKRRFDSIPEPPGPHRAPVSSDAVSHLERLFVEHISTIIAINRSRGIRTVFIGQLFNRDLLDSIPDYATPWLSLLRGKEVWPLQRRFNSILKATSMSHGVDYIDAGIDNFDDSDFTDIGHFSSAGSRKFASLISMEVGSHCR